MSRVSLLPVAYVDASDVLKLPFAFVLKSLTNEEDVKPGTDASGNDACLGRPLASKKLSQSTACESPPMVPPGVSTSVLPSSWNVSSWTASAPTTKNSRASPLQRPVRPPYDGTTRGWEGRKPELLPRANAVRPGRSSSASRAGERPGNGQRGALARIGAVPRLASGSARDAEARRCERR